MLVKISLDITDIKAKEYDLEWIKELRRSTKTDAFGPYVDSCEQEQLRSFMRVILGAVKKDCDGNIELIDEEKERRKLLMHCLINSANRSVKLRSCADEYSESSIRAMLKWDWLRNETFAAILHFSKPENGEMYYQIAAECCIIWNQTCTEIKNLEKNEMSRSSDENQIVEDSLAKAYETRSWLVAIFAKYLEHNEEFLAVCDELIGPSALDTFVDIIDTVMEFRKRGCDINLAKGNVRYILTFLANALKVFGTFDEDDEMEGREIVEGENLNDIFRIFVLLQIMSKKEYLLLYQENTKAAQLVLYVMEGILHYDYCNYRSHSSAVKLGKRLCDRPQIELSRRNAANVNFVRNFAEALRKCNDVNLIEAMKVLCLRLLAVLCLENDLNREYIGKNDGITLLLRCMYIRDGHNPVTRLDAIFTLRFLVLGFPPNQLRLAQLAEEPSAIIDRDGLLRQLSLRAVYDSEAKKIRLEPLERC